MIAIHATGPTGFRFDVRNTAGDDLPADAIAFPIFASLSDSHWAERLKARDHAKLVGVLVDMGKEQPLWKTGKNLRFIKKSLKQTIQDIDIDTQKIVPSWDHPQQPRKIRPVSRPSPRRTSPAPRAEELSPKDLTVTTQSADQTRGPAAKAGLSR